MFAQIREAFSIIAKGHKKAFQWIFIFWSLLSILRLCIPIVTATVIAKLQDNLNFQTLTGVLIFWLIFNSFFQRLLDYLEWFLRDRIDLFRRFFSNQLFQQTFKNLLDMPPLIVENKQAAKILSNIHSIADTLTEISHTSWRLLGDSISWIGASLILLKERPSFALIVLFCSLAQVYSSIQIKKLFSKLDEFTQKRNDINTEKTDHLNYVVTINTLAIQDRILTDIMQKMNALSLARYKNNEKQNFIYLSVIFWEILPLMITSILAAKTALETKDIGHFVLVTGMVGTMIHALEPIVHHFGNMVNNLKIYHKIKDEMQYDHTLDLKFGKGKLPTG